ncbi:MAG: hypothetical protein H6Q37_1741 [Chloroflexi bacterium]|nr:hypothetical protein [Chloroflexota bacterium]
MSTGRVFTIQEADAALSVIRPLLAEMLKIRQEILDAQPEIWPVVEKAAGNGGSKAANLVEQQFKRLDELIHQLQSSGAILKDINIGLVDFLSMRDGREIYLCWQYGEEEIRYWHEIDSGFAGRELL